MAEVAVSVLCVLTIVAFVLYLMWLLATVTVQEEKIIYLKDDIRKLNDKISDLERDLKMVDIIGEERINDFIENLNYTRRFK